MFADDLGDFSGFCGKASILEADDFLGACCRKAMSPKKLWTLLFPPLIAICTFAISAVTCSLVLSRFTDDLVAISLAFRNFKLQVYCSEVWEPAHPLQGSFGPSGPEMAKKSRKMSGGAGDPQKSRKSLGDSPGSLRRVSGNCLESVFGVFRDFLETFWGPGATGPGRHFRDFFWATLLLFFFSILGP